jgi:SAM-dependent methyltransferase
MSDRRRHWDERHAEAGAPGEPSAFVTVELAPLLPEPGRAIDVAGGGGRNSLWLADRGWDVTLVDFSLQALARLDDARIDTIQADLETDLFPEGPWDLILVVHYLDRELFPTMKANLADDGLLAFAIATEHNLERHERPPLPYLLAPGEAPDLVEGMRILFYAEGWSVEGRHEARVVARTRSS